MNYFKGQLVRVISGEYLGFIGTIIHTEIDDDILNLYIQNTTWKATEIIMIDSDSASIIFSDDELTYSAIDRCVCGSGMAIPNKVQTGYWCCADVLTGRSTFIGDCKHSNIEHVDPISILTECKGRTTRPKCQ